MAAIRFYKETTLPGSLTPNSVYFIAPAGSPNYVEVYVTNSSGVARRVLTEADIQAMINASMSAVSEVKVVADIAARNALAPTTTQYVLVQNATADATVASGAATYMWNVSGSAWVKISEAESMDVALTWAALSGKPTSSPSAIDTAVTNSHTHSNKTQLDQIGQDGNGELTYNGQNVRARLDSAGW